MNDPPRPFDLDVAFREHGAFLRRLALALTADPWKADDVVQQTLLSAARSRSAPSRSMRSWLAAIARRTVARARRTDARRSAREAAYARLPAVRDVDREAALRDLADLLASLDEPDRRLLIRRYWEGLTAREIAARDGVPLPTIESRLRRTMARLRDRLDRRTGGGRALWFAAFAGLAGIEPGARWSPLGKGVLLMSTKKLAVAGAAIAALTLTLWMANTPHGGGDGGLETTPPDGSGTEQAALPRRADAAGRDGSAASALPTSAPGREEERDGPLRAGTGRLVVHAASSSGAAVTGLVLRLTALDREAGLVESEAVTDALGVARFTGLPGGRHELVAARGGQDTVTVVEGAERTVRFTLPRAAPLAGVVVDEQGGPVAGAAIHLAFAVDPDHFGLAAVSGAGGAFRLADVASGHLVATAPGFAPSAVHDLDDGRDEELVVRLARGGRTLAVEVVAEDGRPVEDAWVRLVEPFAAAGDEDVPHEAPAGRGHHGVVSGFDRMARTDAAGRAFFEGVGATGVTIEARAVGTAPTTVRSGAATGSRTVRLEAEHRLAGRVVEAGTERPLGGVRISAGPYRGGGRLRGFSATDGSFEIGGLRPGAYTFEVDAGDRGEMRRRVRIGSGPRTRVSWTLDPGLTLTAVVLDDADAPIAGLLVRARRAEFENAVTWRSGATDADGRFTLTSLEPAPQRIELYDREQREQPLLVVEGLEPGPEEQVIRLGREERASAWMTGRVVDDGGAPLADAEITIFGAGILAASVREVGADGRFRYGPFGPGEYTLFVTAPDRGELRPVVTLKAGSDHDLGDVVLARPGRVVARLRSEDAVPGGKPTGAIVSADARSFDLDWSGECCTSPPLAPGTYTLTVRLARHLEASRVVEVLAGETTELDITLRRGAPVRFSFRASDAAAVPGRFRVLVETADGEGIMDRTHRTASGFDFQIYKVLPPGTYRVTVENDLGLHRMRDVTLSAPGGPETPIELDISGR